jgi:hypothetical protein
MVKHLHDICLDFIQSNLDKIPNVGKHLPTVHKELLLKRIAMALSTIVQLYRGNQFY